VVEEGLLCWNCGRPTGVTAKVTRNDQCPHCLADLRCCHGCRHFDPTRRAQCKEPVERAIPNKEKANFCDFFQMRDVFKRPGGISVQGDTKDTRKKKFDDLFSDD
jgi:hypothetical protein